MAGALLFAIGCAPSVNNLQTIAGFPHVVVQGANWKQVSLAITEYNLAKGRKLDDARSNELIIYDQKPLSDSSEQIISKTIYDYTFLPDSVIITSHRYWTNDLDDTTVAEVNDSASVRSEQEELTEIAKEINKSNGGGSSMASPIPSR